jgi:hypothetical protein
MSLFKKLFGSGTGNTPAESKPVAEATHEGFHIVAAPMPEGDQYRLAGTIEKEIGGEVKTHRLIRADMFPSADVAAEATIRKAKRVIDEQGEHLFG